MDIGDRIKQFRTARGYSVNKLATLSGVSQSYLRDIELGNKNPTVEILSVICDTLGISLSEFFNEEISGSFFEDPLLSEVFKLSNDQKNALLQLLKTFQ